MVRSLSPRPGRDRGFTLLEIVCAVGVIVPGLLSLAGVLVLMSHQREQAQARSQAVAGIQSLLEEIQAAPPESLAGLYHGKSYDLSGLAAPGKAKVLSVSVDSTSPRLLLITVSASWTIRGKDESSSLSLEVYNPSG